MKTSALGNGIRLGIVLGAWAAAGARGETAAPAAVLPPPPVVSHDGALVIGAAVETADFRLPVLTFAGTVRTELAAATGLAFGSRKRPVSLALGRERGERGASLSRVRDAAGVVREQVDVPDPGTVDLDELRFVLVRAFLRTWLAEAAESAATQTPPAEPPLWLVRGLARRQNRELRLLDFEQTYRLWSRGRLPLLAVLLEADSPALAEPAVAAVLTGFIGGEGTPGRRFRALLEPLAAGGAWRAGAVLALMDPAGDAVTCERAWDVALLAGARTVIVPGVTPPGVLRRFCSQLRLYPADAAAPLADGWRGMTPAALLAVADQPWARRLAARKIPQVEAAAIGRDATLMLVAQEYALFFRAIAADAGRERAAALLHAAEERLRAAAQQAAAGKVLAVPQVQ